MSGRQRPKFDLNALTQYSLFSVHGEDAASILTSYVTFIAPLVSAAFLSGVQLIGNPIKCWCPAETSDAMCNYTKSICWISQQYVIDYDDAVPRDSGLKDEVQKRQMEFYPMVPFILLILACLLEMPNFLWTAFQGDEGLNIRKAVELAINTERDDEESGKDVSFEMQFNLQRRAAGGTPGNVVWESVKKTATSLGFFLLGRELGTYQTGLFLLTRFLAVGVSVAAAFPFLSYSLQTDFTLWGWALLRWVALDGVEPLDMHVFPRETLCDFSVRQLQNVHKYTVQCVLPINMWSEKVFMVLWFWLGVLIVSNLYSYQYWFRKLLFPHNRRAFISKHLTIIDKAVKKTRKKSVRDFATNFLNHDSLLVLRVLEMSAGNRFANVVVRNLWNEYNERQRKSAAESASLADTD